jgi:hypothetical protein
MGSIARGSHRQGGFLLPNIDARETWMYLVYWTSHIITVSGVPLRVSHLAIQGHPLLVLDLEFISILEGAQKRNAAKNKVCLSLKISS